MRIIPVIGLSVFLNILKEYNSIIAFFVFFNGLLYHSFHNYNFLKFYDIFFNLILILVLSVQHFKILKYHFFFSMTTYMINHYCFQMIGLYNRDISDFIHIFGVQYILSLGLLKILKKNIYNK